MNEFFVLHVLPAMMLMSEQLVSVGMQQTLMIGAMFDAKHQLETIRLFQTKMAKAHKDYHPNLEMCSIGTTADSLAASDRNGEVTAQILMQRSIERQLLDVDTSSSDGTKEDRENRLALFISRYCDLNDNNEGLEPVCNTSAPAETINKDVDYSGLVDTVMTIDADYTDANSSNPATDEIDLLALSANLFSHRVARQLPQTLTETEQAHSAYMDLRSVVAKRSVAENSFYSVVGMKASGTEESENTAEFARIVLEQLGIPQNEAEALLGERPSYYALMQILGKKIYQQPEFFTNLYDKPANVLRKDAALRAIDLMVDRDIYKSDLRQEAVLTVLLELELMKLQSEVQNRINKQLDTTGRNN